MTYARRAQSVHRRVLPALLTQTLHWSLLLTVCVATPLATASHAQASPKVHGAPVASALGTATELFLPGYQTGALEADLPAAMVRLDADQALMILGRTSLWRWQLAPRQLKRMVLIQDGDRSDDLTQLATDGSSWYAASSREVFAVQWEKQQASRFALPVQSGRTLGFSGTGHDFWLIHSSGLFLFDADGHELKPLVKTPFLSDQDQAVMANGKVLWFTHGPRLYKVDLAAPSKAPLPTLAAKHALTDLQVAGQGLIVRTARTVLRLGSNGHLRKSIPVDGQRSLVAMQIAANSHAFLFDDELLEIYRPGSKQVERYRLPLDADDGVDHIEISGQILALTSQGHPRVFQLRPGALAVAAAEASAPAAAYR